MASPFLISAMELILENNFIVVTPSEINLEDVTLEALNVQVLFDCCTELVNEDYDVPHNSATISIPHTINEEDDLFKDGVYQIKITATYTNGSIITETRCIFADTSIKCQVADFIAQAPTSEVGPLYVILLKTNECECNCSTACEILKRIRQIIGQEVTSCNC